MASKLSAAWRRLTATMGDLEAEESLKRATKSGQKTISQVGNGDWAVLRGTVAVVTLKPRGAMPWLEVEVTDGTGTITLVWMGRRAIPGITAGRELTVMGRIAAPEGDKRLYNPRYELRA